MHHAKSPPRFITLVLLTALTTLSLTMFLPSLSNMAADFGVDYALVSLAIAGYLASTAIMQLVLGPLSDRFGRRPVLLAALAVFVLASLGCAAAQNVWVLLAFRVLQASMIAGYAISCAIVRDTRGPRQAASLIGYIGMAMAIGPIVGPMLGGTLDELFGWRASFTAYAGLGAALLVLCWFDLGETHPDPSRTFARQFREYPALLRSTRFWGYAACMAFSTGAFYVFLTGTPIVARSVLDLSPSELGFCMGTVTVGFLLGSVLSGRYAARYPLSTLMIAGRVVACTGLAVGLGLTLTGNPSVVTLFAATACAGIGNGLTMPGSTAGAVSVRPELAGSASGLSGALTVGAGALLSAFTGAAMTDSAAAGQLLGIMLACSALGLLAAAYVRRSDHLEAVPEME